MARKKYKTQLGFGAKDERTPLSREEMRNKIRKTALRLYEERGRIPGRELDDWLDAEKIVKQKYSEENMNNK